jgi:3-oxoacyl-[acyl-carrier protein] reductase
LKPNLIEDTVTVTNVFGFEGKTALVVGGSSGIGNGIAVAFKNAGAEVYVWGTRPTPASYKPEEGSNLEGLHYSQVDASDDAMVESYSVPFAALDVLVLVQGAVLYNRAEYSMAGFRKVVDVNLHSLMACSLKFYEMLKLSRGALITVSSTAAFHANVGNPAYNASKAGAVGLTRTLGAAWAKDGIRVNGIAPGLVATKLTRVTVDNPKRLEAALKRIPCGRLGTPQDMAGAALFLASPFSSYIVGHTIPVDGGLVLV